MRILIINPNWKAYSEVWLHRMMNYVASEIVGVACFSPEKKYWKKNVPTFDLCGPKRSSLGGGLKKLKVFDFLCQTSMQVEFTRFIQKTKPTLIFINFIGPALYLKKILIEADIPIFIHVHGGDIFWNIRNTSTLLPLHSLTYQQEVLDFCNDVKYLHFITNSFFSKDQLLIIGIPENKISVKYFGVQSGSAKRDFNKELKVLYLGRFVDFKGPDLVLEAFIQACSLGFTGTLTMVGDGELKSMCMLMALRSKYAHRISFKNPVSENEATELFQKADVYTMHNCLGILSHQAETFGVTIIEAMAQGTPVITGKIGGVPEIIIDRYNGFLLDPGSVQEHAKAFLFLQNNPEKLLELSHNCIKTIEKKFLPDFERTRLFEIFNRSFKS
ncbi:MAG: glycosyltransferase family 4 protein [Ginsengibacter sp.]